MTELVDCNLTVPFYLAPPDVVAVIRLEVNALKTLAYWFLHAAWELEATVSRGGA